jgi:hypothetical protein
VLWLSLGFKPRSQPRNFSNDTTPGDITRLSAAVPSGQTLLIECVSLTLRKGLVNPCSAANSWPAARQRLQALPASRIEFLRNMVAEIPELKI